MSAIEHRRRSSPIKTSVICSVHLLPFQFIISCRYQKESATSGKQTGSEFRLQLHPAVSMTFVHVYSLADSKVCNVGGVECNEVADRISNPTNIHVMTQPRLGRCLPSAWISQLPPLCWHCLFCASWPNKSFTTPTNGRPCCHTSTVLHYCQLIP